MANNIQVRRGANASLPTLNAGEFGFSTDTKQVHIGDGAANHEFVMNNLFNANTILAADTDNTPAALEIAEDRLLGRITGGNIVGLTADQVRTLLDIDDIVTPENIVMVDPDSPEKAGSRYQTWSAADTYVQTQTPSATNIWGIKISGTNSENIVFKDYTYIIGDVTTRLTGAVNSTAANAFAAFRCLITNLSLSGGVLVLQNCEISGGTTSGGIILGDYTTFSGGNLSSSTLLWFSFCTVSGAATIPAGTWYFCNIANGTWTGTGGTYFNQCIVSNTATLSGSITMNGGFFLGADTVPASKTWNLYNVGCDNTITVSATAILNTKGCSNITVSNSGTWNNTGDTYDNTASGLTATNTQAAIDEVTNNLILDTSISNLTGSGIKVSSTVDVNAFGFAAALFLASDGHYETCDADSSSTMPCTALALETGTGTKNVLLLGLIRDDTWDWTPGSSIYVSCTTGDLTDTAPSGTGDQVQRIGFAYSADIIYFKPDLTVIEVS